MGYFAPAASALDTPNVLMGFDGMALNHFGLFRNPTGGQPADGFNTFQFGGFSIANPLTTGNAYGNQLKYGRYTAYRFQKNAVGDCCISQNARIHTDSPEHWNGTAYAGAYPLDITNAYAPVIDRAAFGQLFDPTQYQIEVKFKPLVQSAFPTGPTIPANLLNTATLMQVSLDRHGGYIWDAEVGTYKRAAEQIIYNIGTPLNAEGQPVNPDLAINTWYASAPKDADNYATWTVPVTSPSFAQRSFYWGYAQVQGLLDDSLANGGRVQNPDGTWANDTTAYEPGTQDFGGGPTDPNRPNVQLKTPNGTPLIAFGAPNATVGLNVEIKYIALKRITPGPLVARLDPSSGITYRFGSGFTYGNTQPGIPVPGDPFGLGYQPAATDQISRFDDNGMLPYVDFDMRTPDNANETHRFILRNAPGPNQFNGTQATVNIRARLPQGITDANGDILPGFASSLQIVAKDLDGNDTAANPFGADEYRYTIDLNQFNTETFTTISVPLSSFTLQTFVPPPPPPPDGRLDSAGPFGFANPGDAEMTDFNLYEFGGLVAPNTGLLKLQLEFMEIRLPTPNIPGDHNKDGVVDAADYVAWKKNPSAFNGTPLGYDEWVENFGEMLGGGGEGGVVPEPATWLLLAMAASALGFTRRHAK
jgi:hypothetical protein